MAFSLSLGAPLTEAVRASIRRWRPNPLVWDAAQLANLLPLPRARRARARAVSVLEVCSNLSMPASICGWERELLLPVVGRLLEGVLLDAAQAAEDGVHEDEQEEG